jgi:serine/threonine protein kinase
MPKIKLADFGLAKEENLMSENTICGTEAYLPPPLNKGTRPQDVGMNWASDSYALGVVTYQL